MARSRKRVRTANVTSPVANKFGSRQYWSLGVCEYKEIAISGPRDERGEVHTVANYYTRKNTG